MRNAGSADSNRSTCLGHTRWGKIQPNCVAIGLNISTRDKNDPMKILCLLDKAPWLLDPFDQFRNHPSFIHFVAPSAIISMR
jgi:hypothetical protein